MATKLFVGSLPSVIDEPTFRQLFEQHGQVVSSVCNGDKRYGFVTYSSMEEAQNAINNMNGYSMNGASIVVKLADNQGSGGPSVFNSNHSAFQPSTPMAGDLGPQVESERIYIKGLPAGMTDDSVRQIFAAYGAVSDSKVLVANGKSSDGQGQSVAIVRMGSVTEAKWLVDNVNGNIPQGLAAPVEIKFAADSQRGGGGGARYSPYSGSSGGGTGVQTGSYGVLPALPPTITPQGNSHNHSSTKGGPGSDSLIPNIQLMMQQSGSNATLYVKGLPMHADDLYLYKAFSPFGCILSAKALPKDGYVIGFVHYASEDMAQGAIQSLNGLTLMDGATLQVAIKTSK
uniref:RRM domain-containing protein n=1 Tax=Alexandrium monilatum TaxID=311494 RepID=A0A7S4Q429_9DINO